MDEVRKVKKSRYVVLECLQNLSSTQKNVTTVDLAKCVGLSRGVVTTYLSQLLKEGLVEKSGTKPVYWHFIKAKTEDYFQKFIGANGSLSRQIEECKAAVLYPPNGFPLIITGESGVGKSYLASLIFDYAMENKQIAKSANFVSLNCADYANNPELLSSVLFGYRKGAFTGADKDTDGLVKHADGGFLFLDEVHRLNNESQEKLFTILDSGNYYPLGEKETPEQATVRFLFATTENLDDTLLRTFQRRVPMNIELTSYHQRPINERLLLIFSAFLQEGNRLNKAIIVEQKLLFELANKQYKGNIGDLRNQIRLLTAKAFLQQKDQKEIFIGKDQTLVIRLEKNSSISQLANHIISRALKQLSEEVIKSDSSMNDMRFIIKKRLRKIRNQFGVFGVNDQIIESYVGILEEQMAQMNEKYGVFSKMHKEDSLNAGLLIYLGKYSEQIIIEATFINKLRKRYHRSVYLVRVLVEGVREVLSLTDVQLDFLEIMFFYTLIGEEWQSIESIKTLCLLLSHGNMASSIQKVVNPLCENYVFEAFDMPIDVSMKEISEKVKSFINKQHCIYQEVILLFDMGSLSQMYKEIKPHSAVDLMVINNLTTAMALDVALQVKQGIPFKKIAQKAEQYGELTNVQYYEGLSQNRNIIVSCMSGVGLSEAIKDIMVKNLKPDTEIITMDYKDLKQTLNAHEIAYFENTKFILTTTDLHEYKELSIINIYDVMEEKGASEFKQLLVENGENDLAADNVLEEFLQFFTIEGIGKRLEFLNPAVVIKEVQSVIEMYEQYYEFSLTGRNKLNLYMHIALMIERMLVSSRKNNETEGNKFFLEEEKKEFYSVSKNVFHAIETKYNIIIDDYELSLMYELLKSTF